MNNFRINRIIKEEVDNAIDDAIYGDGLNDDEYDDLMSQFSDYYDEEDEAMRDSLIDPDWGKEEYYADPEQFGQMY